MNAQILLLSDIHGNFPALQAIETFFKGKTFEKIINCGDSTVYAPFPNETLDWLKQNEAISILGNTDKKVLKLLSGKGFKKPSKEEKRIMYSSTAKVLNDQNRSYLKSLPKKNSFKLQGEEKGSKKRIGIFHGSPEHPHEFLFATTEDKRFLELAVNCPFDIVVTGHSHTPYHKFIGGVHFINPGSVGRMFDGNPAGSCAVLSFSEKGVAVSHYRIDYDIDRITNALKQQHLPEIYSDMYQLGRKLN